MKPSPRRIPLILGTVLAVAVSTFASSAFAQCPQSCIDTATPPCSTDPVRTGIRPGDEFTGSSSGTYNLPLGTARAGGASDYGTADVNARDDYRVVGVPAGTPLTFAAEWNYVFGASGTAGAGAYIGLGDVANIGALESNLANPNFSVPRKHILPLNVAAGDVFRLTMRVYASAYLTGGVNANGTLLFTGLPPGARVESCNGFVQDFPVPALPASWGRVKDRYR